MAVAAGYDYVLSGYSWPNPSHITYSIPADGIDWDHGINNLNATFNAKFGAGVWERIFARALATWESVANIEISPVADGNEPFNILGQAQGDPRFGDIRLGGYPYPSNTTTLAQTYYPPPNGSTAAGDFEANTSIDFNIGSQYDLYSVVLHEMGHALGLEHAQNPADVMYADYEGIRAGLGAGDIAGIQAIYGARTADAYQSVGLGTSFSSPIDISANLTSSPNVDVSGVSLPSIGSSEYFSFTTPADTAHTLTVTAAASNISMLSPKISLYDASGQLISESSDSSTWSDNVTVTDTSIAPGQHYYAVVTGATGDYFDVGAYQLQVSLPGVTAPVSTGSGSSGSSPPSSPPVTTPQPISTTTTTTSTTPLPDRFEPNNCFSQAASLGKTTLVTLNNLTISSSSETDYFRFKSAGQGIYQVIASGLSIDVYNSKGKLLADGSGQVSIKTSKTASNYVVMVESPTHSLVFNYSLTISYSHSPKAASKVQAVNKTVASEATGTSTASHLTKASLVTETVTGKTHSPFHQGAKSLTMGIGQAYPTFSNRSTHNLRVPLTWAFDLGSKKPLG